MSHSTFTPAYLSWKTQGNGKVLISKAADPYSADENRVTRAKAQVETQMEFFLCVCERTCTGIKDTEKQAFYIGTTKQIDQLGANL